MSRRRCVIVLCLVFVVGFNVMMWVRNSNELHWLHEVCRHSYTTQHWPDCISAPGLSSYFFLYMAPWIAGDLLFLAGGCVFAAVWIKRRLAIPQRPDIVAR
jgi:hypothetical protein